MTEELFGPYRVLDLIGRGGMGEVHRAFDTGRGRVVALKRLPPSLAADPEFRARFRKEAALAARLHEPHIIPIHDFGEIDGRLYIDMRLVDGSDLATVLAQHGPLPPRRAANVVAQVAAALDVAHADGLVHRDIKPGNVLVTPGIAADGGAGEFVYVADFGIARSVAGGSTSLTATGATVGSLDYMAPERFSGQGDHLADVYALGCLLYEALSACRPFPVDGVPAKIHAHLSAPPPRPSDVVAGLSPELDAVVARAMAKEPDRRYSTAGALAAAAWAAAGGGADPAITTVAPVAGPTIVAPPAGPPNGWTPSSDAGSAPQWGARPPEWGHAPTEWGAGPAASSSGARTWGAGPGVAGAATPAWGPEPAAAGAATPAWGPGPAASGTQVPGPVPQGWGPPPDVRVAGHAAAPRRERGRWGLVALVVVVFAALTGGAYLLGFVGPPSSTTLASQIRTEPVRTAGANPFMPPVGDDRTGVTAPAGTGGSFEATTAGLFGGTLDNASCDAGAMTAFLEADPDKAAAWAGVQGIEVSQIRSYVAGLTPVILRSDTAVTNHGYADGRATVVPSVLQAGTAVLVDRFGMPRARCYCGNPLTAAGALSAAPTYVGVSWPGFAPGAVTTIRAATTPITEFTLVDPADDSVFRRPAGTSGSDDRPDTPPPLSGTFPVNRPVFAGAGFTITLESVEVDASRLRASVVYRNTGSSPLALTCRGYSDPRLSYIVVGSTTIYATDTFCSSNPDLDFTLQVGESSTSFGTYPIDQVSLTGPFTLSWSPGAPVEGIVLAR